MCFCHTFLALEASCLWSFMLLPAVCELSSSCLLGKIIGNMSWNLTKSQQISINLIILFLITECLHFFFGLIFKLTISVHVFFLKENTVLICWWFPTVTNSRSQQTQWPTNMDYTSHHPSALSQSLDYSLVATAHTPIRHYDRWQVKWITLMPYLLVGGIC